MRWDNVILSTICGAAIVVAGTLAWRGRRLPIMARRTIPVSSPQTAVLDALRSIACVLDAGLIAGGLVVGLGGRLVMRVLAATSGGAAQGLLTEADETVGEITFGGTVGFVLFAGIGIPLAASFVYLVIKRVLPQTAWIAGLVFGLLLLATFGVGDPLSPDNVDFVILTPRWLAVALVSATALLFGMTFTSLAARLDARVPVPRAGAPAAPLRARLAYASLIWLVIPIFLVPAAVYVIVRGVAHGRVGSLLDRGPVYLAGRVAVAIAGVLSLGLVVEAAADII